MALARVVFQQNVLLIRRERGLKPRDYVLSGKGYEVGQKCASVPEADNNLGLYKFDLAA